MDSYLPLCPNSLQPSLVPSTSSQICKLPLAVPSISLGLVGQKPSCPFVVSRYTCTYWSRNVCLPIRWAEGVSVCLQNDVPCGVLPSNTGSGDKTFEFSPSFAKSLSQCGVSLNLQELHVFEIFNSLLNWAVIGWQVTVSLICLWEKQGLSFWNWY